MGLGLMFRMLWKGPRTVNLKLIRNKHFLNAFTKRLEYINLLQFIILEYFVF